MTRRATPNMLSLVDALRAATCFDCSFDVLYHSWQLLQARTNPSLERQQDPSYARAATPLSKRLRGTGSQVAAAGVA